MGLMQRVLAKALPQVDRRIDWRVDRKLEERVLPQLPRQTEALAGLSDDLSTVSEKLLFTMSELRRWMVDDLEAANETTMLLGESLTRLQTSVDRIEGEIAALGQRLADLEASAPTPTAGSSSTCRRSRASTSATAAFPATSSTRRRRSRPPAATSSAPTRSTPTWPSPRWACRSGWWRPGSCAAPTTSTGRRPGCSTSPRPLEMSVPEDRLLPPGARAAGVPWVVTFYDLIPHLMPDYYLEDPGLRRRYRARLQSVRTATAVLTLSEASRADIVEHLGLDPRRVFVVGAGTSDRFVPPASRPEAAAAAAARPCRGCGRRIVFYIGSYEKRKNLEPLLEAWSRLPEAVRARWQLALCCPLRPLERNHLLHRADQLGIADSVCLTGFVDDDTLLLLHQGSDLFVFPSLYEGYGLPVAEALACGAPVLAADASSLPEIVGPEALFDPTRSGADRRGHRAGPDRRGAPLAAAGGAGRAPTSWAEVATATMDVYSLVSRQGAATDRAGLAPPAGARPGAGWPSPAPLPPDGGPVADWNLELLEALAGRADLDVQAFADRPAVCRIGSLVRSPRRRAYPSTPWPAWRPWKGSRGPSTPSSTPWPTTSTTPAAWRRCAAGGTASSWPITWRCPTSTAMPPGPGRWPRARRHDHGRLRRRRPSRWSEPTTRCPGRRGAAWGSFWPGTCWPTAADGRHAAGPTPPWPTSTPPPPTGPRST